METLEQLLRPESIGEHELKTAHEAERAVCAAVSQRVPAPTHQTCQILSLNEFYNY
jgi:hypothetical protein